MSPRKVQGQLRDLLETAIFARHDRAGDFPGLDTYVESIRQIATYDDVGMLTRDKGLLIEYEDGSEYQVTIVESKSSGDNDDDES